MGNTVWVQIPLRAPTARPSDDADGLASFQCACLGLQNAGPPPVRGGPARGWKRAKGGPPHPPRRPEAGRISPDLSRRALTGSPASASSRSAGSGSGNDPKRATRPGKGAGCSHNSLGRTHPFATPTLPQIGLPCVSKRVGRNREKTIEDYLWSKRSSAEATNRRATATTAKSSNQPTTGKNAPGKRSIGLKT